MRPFESFLTGTYDDSQSDNCGQLPWKAELDLRFERVDKNVNSPERSPSIGRTVMTDCRHRGPLRVQKPLYPEGPAICHAIVLHPPAGIAAGDELAIGIGVGNGARAVITTPGAAKWYRSNGHPACQTISLRLDEGAHLDWLPLENILFDRAHARMRLDIHCAATAIAIGWDACVLGRRASGEIWDKGNLSSRIELRCGGKLRWVENFELPAANPLRIGQTALAGMPVLATMWAVGPTVDEALAETLAAQMPWSSELRAGITCLRGQEDSSGILLMRALGQHVEAVQLLMRNTWLQLRPTIHGVAGQPLRLWAT